MGGSSKRGGGHTPHEAPDSLRSAQKLRAIGLISLGPIKGPANKWKDTYFDNTPIQNANGVDDKDKSSFNFKNTEIQYNLGYQDQSPLDGFEASEREVSVGAEVKQQHPITRSVIDPDVTRLRLTMGVNALISQNDKGDTNGTSVDFQVLINGTPRGTYQISGKSSSRFYRSYIIDELPPRPFTVTVQRLTEDSKSQRLQNGTHWVSYTEIIDTKLSYPNMAIVGIKTDSRYNPNFPNINFLLYGRIIKIPTTYDPEARTYAPGLWRGDFKLGWTNNPAWIFYDLITDKLAGLGQRIGDFGIDKFMLYEIAKYCDELVDDGYGGKEPRMVSNLWITEQRDAYNVISDMASVFRAIAVWDGAQFTAIQDRPTDPVCLYTQSNIVNGKITRQYAAGKSIFTAVEVEYADERNLYQKAIEYVADDSMIARYGYNVKKMTAYGCTSRGQAHRYGRWVLETSRLEQCTITFAVGRQGLMHLPGDIIEVADNSYAGVVLGGRVIAINGKTVTLDSAVELKGESYLSYLNADFKMTKVKVKSVDKSNAAIVELESEPVGLSVYDNWVVKTGTVSTQLYRALGISENEDGSYTITALQHEPQKEAIVDGSASFMPAATTAHRAGVSKPANADVSYGDGGVKLTWTTPTTPGKVRYDVKLYRNGNLYSTHLDLDDPEISFDNLPSGSYIVEIRSKNSAGQLSDPVTRTFEINLDIKRFVTKSLLFAIELDWDLPKTATVGNYTEVWRSETNDISKAVKVATLPYPQNNYVMSGISLNAKYYFWLRCGDKNDNKGEFTAPVFGEADHNPESLLKMVEETVTKVGVGKELIENLKGDINKAVSEEAKARQAAVNKAFEQIQTQAQTTGTAIKKLEKTDKDQAEAIKTVTAKAETALSGITAVRQAQAQSDKANAQQINALTAKVGKAEATVTQMSSTVAALDGKVSSTHTIRTQAINGGRTAIAGIALGANEKESSVIVMADKFGIVANANDGNVKQVFSVANGQVGIRGDLVVAGTVTRDKLSSSGAGNLLTNPIFANPTNGVPHGWFSHTNQLPQDRIGERACVQDEHWGPKRGAYLPGENVIRYSNRPTGDPATQCGIWQNVPLIAGKTYILSCYVGNHRGKGIALFANTKTGSGELIAYNNKVFQNLHAFAGFKYSSRIFIKFTAPENTASADVYIIMMDVDPPDNNYGYMFAARPMLEECNENATEPSPWVNAGVTQVHGGSIIANTVRGEHIQANQTIRAPVIEGGSLNINNRFVVNNSGGVSIRANSGNVGMVITNDRIDVYDESGNLRVRLGKLS
ncbi:host specificity protein J [Aggregatibacter actinomycetemcomitans]|uniref:host specificity protein J n=1 Tax=Aggregatibacter actinomycetemcomitans TaxID=714 RepID=UPI00215144BD|nr:phage tail protein [Aggregatibacter actinomycetemcomitans]